jgi:polar amino acid transport system substrate-binding protein
MNKALLSLVLLYVMSVPGHAQTVVLATGTWEPYVSEKQQDQGPIAHIVKRSFELAGIQAVMHFCPWKQCEILVADGGVYAAFPYAETQYRNEFAEYSDAIMVTRDAFFYLKERLGDVDFSSINNLKTYSIGSTIGYSHCEQLEKEGIKPDPAPTEKSNFLKLESGRVDLVPSDELTGWKLIGELFPDQVNRFASTNAPCQRTPLRLMVSKSYPGAADITGKFNEGLAKLKASGEFKKILSEHNIPE